MSHQAVSKNYMLTVHVVTMHDDSGDVIVSIAEKVMKAVTDIAYINSSYVALTAEILQLTTLLQ